MLKQQDTGVGGPQAPCGALCLWPSCTGGWTEHHGQYHHCPPGASTKQAGRPRPGVVSCRCTEMHRRISRSPEVERWLPIWTVPVGTVVRRAGAGSPGRVRAPAELAMGPSAQEWRKGAKDRKGPWSESMWNGMESGNPGQPRNKVSAIEIVPARVFSTRNSQQYPRVVATRKTVFSSCRGLPCVPGTAARISSFNVHSNLCGTTILLVPILQSKRPSLTGGEASSTTSIPRYPPDLAHSSRSQRSEEVAGHFTVAKAPT